MTRRHQFDTESVLRLCDQRRWTNRKLAREAGINDSGLSRALRGLARPSDRTVRLVARALNVPVSEITTATTTVRASGQAAA